MASIDFINECKNGANHNRLGQIRIAGLNPAITESDNLANFSIDSGCFVDGNIIGSIYIKKLEANFLALDDDVDLIDKIILPKIGVKYADSSVEYIEMGKYVVERPNDLKTANKCKITAYDELINNIDKKYVSTIDYSNGNITLKDLYVDVCNQLNLVPTTNEFLNDNIPILANPFTNNEKNRIVLQTIAKISCSFITIDYENYEINLSWLSDSNEPDYTFTLTDYSTLEGGTITYGPINSVILKNSQIDDENVSMQDSESIDEFGEHSLVISEDYILYNAELRQMAITNIFNRLNGLKYVDSKITCYYGKPFLKIGNKIRIYTDSENYFDTYILKHKFTYDGTFESIIESPALTEQEIKTKQDTSLQQLLSNTQIEINKQNQTISATIQTVNEQSTKINNVTQSVDSLNITISEQQNIFDNLNNTVISLEGSLHDMTFDFSTKGLAIGTNSDINNSLLDNTGVKVYNYNKLNAIFNNKGSGIEKLIVTDTAQLGYLKFIKSTKNNKPVTKIFHLKELIQDLEDLE